MRSRIIAAAALLSIGHLALGQGAESQILAGDREHAGHNLRAALQHYDAAIRAEPANYTALVKAANDAADLAEFDDNKTERDSLFRNAEQYARRAVAANPGDAEGHFQMARAIGRTALTMGTRDRVKFAGVVRDEALAALKINPDHSGALHVMGVWNAEVMRLNGFSRMIAKNFLGGKVFDEASWDNAQRYLEMATKLDPTQITHHLDLAAVYEDRGNKAKAIEQYELIARLPATDYNDPRYKQMAAARLEALR